MPKKWLVLALLVCASCFSTAFADDKAPFDRLVVFGTSLSDPGNAFALAGGVNTPPDYSVDMFLVPDRPYARGGHHFSNGATWVEQLARQLGLAASANPAFRGANSQATNYAVGGARARDAGASFNLSDQVDAFLADVYSAPANALYVIEMGGNDLRDALVAAQTGGPAAALAIAQEAVDSINDQIMRLYVAGARNFLVWTAPDIGLTPAINRDPVAAGFANQLAQFFNGNLQLRLAQLATMPGIRIALFDVYAKLNTVHAQPQLFDLRNVMSACITPNVPPFACKQPDEFLFWDGIHPTKAGHAILAEEAARLLLQ
jgi:phospholipase/lecithinase/hemolysin